MYFDWALRNGGEGGARNLFLEGDLFLEVDMKDRGSGNTGEAIARYRFHCTSFHYLLTYH